MNFGESLALWYFRLNGFFPLANFVLHRPDRPRRYNADADILAVRFPHVHEEVGGQADDWDNARFDRWGVRHAERTVCVIAEVKTGAYSTRAIGQAFRPTRLHYALRRLGNLTPEDCDLVRDRLSAHSVVDYGSFVFVKVLLSSAERRTGNHRDEVPYEHIELADAVTFIRGRMQRYRRDKNAARMLFPDELIQFFAWEAGLPGAERDQE